MAQQMQSYDFISKCFHWISALWVFILFFLGDWMVDLGYYHSWYQESRWWHISLGLLLLLILPWRFFWRLYKQSSIGFITNSKIQQWLIKITHLLLYFLLLSVCVSGIFLASAADEALLFFNFFELPALNFDDFAAVELISQKIHQYLAYGLMILISLHFSAVIKHQLIDKQPILKRMV